MKKRLFTFLLLGSTISSLGQETFLRNSIYLEAGGNGIFASVNYERQLTRQPGLGARIGLGYYVEDAFYMTIPAGINYLFPLRKENAFIDAGLGITWARIDGRLFKTEDNPNGNHLTHVLPSIGYRQHTRRQVLWRVNLAAVANKHTLMPWLGLSVGKRF